MHGFAALIEAYGGKHYAYVSEVEQRKPAYRQSF